MTVQLVNPANGLKLVRDGDWLTDEGGGRYPIIGGIPRVCDPSNYTESFGFQWNKFAATQIDSAVDEARQSERRLFLETAWQPDSLDGVDILEVGSGAGRFTRVLLERTKANLSSVDFSAAVEANWRNNGQVAPGRLSLAQASVYELPFADGSFDKVFCFGVLQHTPDFEEAVGALVRKAKPGGEIVVDFYAVRGFWTKLHAKYMLRPFTRRLSHERLLKLIDSNADWLINLAQALRTVGLGPATRFLPLVDLRTLPQGLTRSSSANGSCSTHSICFRPHSIGRSELPPSRGCSSAREPMSLSRAESTSTGVERPWSARADADCAADAHSVAHFC